MFKYRTKIATLTKQRRNTVLLFWKKKEGQLQTWICIKLPKVLLVFTEIDRIYWDLKGKIFLAVKSSQRKSSVYLKLLPIQRKIKIYNHSLRIKNFKSNFTKWSTTMLRTFALITSTLSKRMTCKRWINLKFLRH